MVLDPVRTGSRRAKPAATAGGFNSSHHFKDAPTLSDILDEALNRELAVLRSADGHPIDAIKLIRGRMGVSLGEAKAIFANHPAWADVHEANQPLHDAAEQAARGFGKPSQ